MSSAPIPAGQAAREFHARFGLAANKQPTARVPERERRLRARLLIEEAVELICALEAVSVPDGLVEQIIDLLPATEGVTDVDLHNVAMEIADVTYVNAGTAVLYGIDHDEALAAVHAANLTKLPGCFACVDDDPRVCAGCGGSGYGAPLRRADGKVLKSDRYQPADLTGALRGI